MAGKDLKKVHQFLKDAGTYYLATKEIYQNVYGMVTLCNDRDGAAEAMMTFIM